MGSPVVAIDSWLSVDGQVLAFAAHLERFASSVERTGGSRQDAVAAMHAARVETPRSGDFFPRIAYTQGSSGFDYQHDIRPAPQRLATAALWTAPFDPRRRPDIKGPDLAELAGLRLLAAEHDANEAVVLANEVVVEAAHSSIAWWRGDTLCYPDETLLRVNSVTWQVVRTVAASLGVPVSQERATPHDLAGCEVWVMSALHGIRGATTWVNGPDLAPPERRDLWQARLIALRERDEIR